MNNNLEEAGLSRVLQHMQKSNSGILTAWHKNFSYAQNLERNRSLLVKIRMRYSVIQVRGRYPYIDKKGADAVKQEISFFVYGSENGDDLRNQLIRWGMEFDQESILYIPKYSKNLPAWKAELIFTTGPQVGETMMELSALKVGEEAEYMTKVGDRPLYFESFSGMSLQYYSEMAKVPWQHLNAWEAKREAQSQLNERLAMKWDVLPVSYVQVNKGKLAENWETSAFWVIDSGWELKVLDITGTTHINYLMNHPETFNLTRADIEKLYAEYGEKLGQEGEAREILIKQVAKRGWMRVRHYVGKRDYWSMQVDDTHKRMRTIKAFIHQMLQRKLMTPHDDAEILGYEVEGDFQRFTFQDGGISGLLKEAVLDPFASLKEVEFQEFH